MTSKKHQHLGGSVIDPPPLSGRETLPEVIDQTFTAYNAGRLREACQLLTQKMLQADVTLGVSLSGALTPAGYAKSCLVPLIEVGCIDWIVSTGANLYHDTHHALGLSLHAGSPHTDDVELRRDGVVRIYDIVFDYDVLLETDRFYRRALREPEFEKRMSTAEFHYRLGRYVVAVEERLDRTGTSLLGAAYRHAVPVFTSSPGDSSIGLNVAELALEGCMISFDVNLDVNLSTAIVWDAKDSDGKSACLMLGGGSPKNFILQTEPQIQEILGLADTGHDYYLQITDARPDTGGLSGATPGEAVSWGKVDPGMLGDTVVVYTDSSIALPLLSHYVMASGIRRPPRRLYDRLPELLAALQRMFDEKKQERIAEGRFSESDPAPRA
jgi:deoxyhypusine synthase